MALAMLAGAEIAKLDWPYDAPAPVPWIIRTAIKVFGAVKIRNEKVQRALPRPRCA
jgi:hypothetical protein